LLAFGLTSPADLAIIFVLALLLFGPNKLPEIGKQLGTAMKELRKITDEFTSTVASVKSEVEPAFKTSVFEPARQSVPEVLAPAETVAHSVPVDGTSVTHEVPQTIPTGGLRISSLPPTVTGSPEKGE
jgi:sec-independent protein translocase protein TatA